MGPSLLIVDDEANFLVLLERILSREDYQVTAARGAGRAIHHLDRKNFDLAILDIKMYPMGGVELLTEIKERSPATHVIMVTAYPTDDTRNECVKLGAAGYLSKPIDLLELKAVLRHFTAATERSQRVDD